MEGHLHKSLKNIVANELENHKYSIYFEPLESPLNLLWWHSYRPDVLAIKSSLNQIYVILVECETKPNKKRLNQKMDKIRKNLSLQKQLHRETHFLPLLVIPPFNLSKIICSELRKFWEIWIINNLGTIKHKINSLNNQN
ncbi:MAG: hypothetical protein P8Y18_00315 [Candidatus Bathyarchaeota archaeon]